MNARRSLAAALLACATGLGATGCVASVWVPAAPPDAVVEVQGAVPAPGYVWIEGNWVWRGGWVWHPGRWTAPPHAGATWERGRWERSERGWRWHDGYWR